MQKLKELSSAYIKKLFADLHSAVVSVVVVAFFLGVGGIYLFAKNVWNPLINILQTPTPLWATIALVLLVALYIQTKIKLIAETSQLLPVKKIKIKFFDIGDYRWKATIYRPDYFELDKYPYCPIHDTRFIFGRDKKFCPGNDNNICKNNLPKRDEFSEYEAAKSIIESKIRNNENC